MGGPYLDGNYLDLQKLQISTKNLYFFAYFCSFQRASGAQTLYFFRLRRFPPLFPFTIPLL